MNNRLIDRFKSPKYTTKLHVFQKSVARRMALEKPLNRLFDGLELYSEEDPIFQYLCQKFHAILYDIPENRVTRTDNGYRFLDKEAAETVAEFYKLLAEQAGRDLLRDGRLRIDFVRDVLNLPEQLTRLRDDDHLIQFMCSHVETTVEQIIDYYKKRINHLGQHPVYLALIARQYHHDIKNMLTQLRATEWGYDMRFLQCAIAFANELPKVSSVNQLSMLEGIVEEDFETAREQPLLLKLRLQFWLDVMYELAFTPGKTAFFHVIWNAFEEHFHPGPDLSAQEIELTGLDLLSLRAKLKLFALDHEAKQQSQEQFPFDHDEKSGDDVLSLQKYINARDLQRIVDLIVNAYVHPHVTGRVSIDARPADECRVLHRLIEMTSTEQMSFEKSPVTVLKKQYRYLVESRLREPSEEPPGKLENLLKYYLDMLSERRFLTAYSEQLKVMSLLQTDMTSISKDKSENVSRQTPQFFKPKGAIVIPNGRLGLPLPLGDVPAGSPPVDTVCGFKVR